MLQPKRPHANKGFDSESGGIGTRQTGTANQADQKKRFNPHTVSTEAATSEKKEKIRRVARTRTYWHELTRSLKEFGRYWSDYATLKESHPNEIKKTLGLIGKTKRS